MKFAKTNNSLFYTGLKQYIDSYFQQKSISSFGNYTLLVKALVLLSVYCLAYAAIYLTSAVSMLLIVYAVLGITGVLIVFNIVHDASHRAIFQKASWNNYLCYLGDVIGINTYIWNIRHNQQHHAFTNILGGDLIIEHIPLIRLSEHQPYQRLHRFQPYYAPLLYLGYSFYWIFVVDIKLFFKKEICNKQNIVHPKVEWLKLLAFKSFYVCYMVLLPWWFSSWQLGYLLLAFAVMHMAAGLLLSFVAVLGHFVEGPSFPQAPGGVIDNSWGEHELEATIDFAPRSRFINWVTGGLNTHVAHHLFPRMCHVHYYHITPLIEQYCTAGGYPYKKEPLFAALSAHFRYLKKLAQPTV